MLPCSAVDGPYTPLSQDELRTRYPDSLKLILVQSIFRHGERAPVRARLESAGVPQHFNLCHHVGKFNASVRLSASHSNPVWGTLRYRRAVEEMDKGGKAKLANVNDGTCLLGELTDKGRRTTFELGRRLRDLYVDQLGFVTKIKESDLYLRSSPMPRALESLQQVFSGFFPFETSGASDFVPVFRQRNFTEENLFPNEVCRSPP